VPTVLVDCSPAPTDCRGWYRSDVTINWTVLPSGAAVAGCEDKTLTTDRVEVVEFCRASDGQPVTVEIPISIDKTAPVVTGGDPVRGSDFNGWFNHPVTIAFRGSDLTSGIASCTTPTYAGPDTGAAVVFGTCMDRAGNLSSPFGYGLRFDATPPPLSDMTAAGGDRRVTVSWQTSGEAEAVHVVRTPGLRSESSSVVYSGVGERFADDAVRNGRRYVYEVSVRDAAGNSEEATDGVVPGPRLVAPVRLTVVRASRPPLLRWTPVRGASYYNVQLYRDGRKILTAWPTGASYRLKKRWNYAGVTRRLTPGRYRWLVWPGFGRRSESDYGERLGPTAFRVRAAR
jgi:hypothetical protein